jgi:hypothetical protein
MKVHFWFLLARHDEGGTTQASLRGFGLANREMKVHSLNERSLKGSIRDNVLEKRWK